MDQRRTRIASDGPDDERQSPNRDASSRAAARSLGAGAMQGYIVAQGERVAPANAERNSQSRAASGPWGAFRYFDPSGFADRAIRYPGFFAGPDAIDAPCLLRP